MHCFRSQRYGAWTRTKTTKSTICQTSIPNHTRRLTTSMVVAVQVVEAVESAKMAWATTGTGPSTDTTWTHIHPHPAQVHPPDWFHRSTGLSNISDTWFPSGKHVMSVCQTSVVHVVLPNWRSSTLIRLNSKYPLPPRWCYHRVSTRSR